jgi:hypothetical protein
MTTRISRRKVLRGMLAGVTTVVSLPRLDAMLNGNGTAYAAGGPLPRRFGVWAWANGAHPNLWVPAQTGATWTLTDELMPLASVKDVMTVVSGMHVPHAPGRGHVGPHTHLMTGLTTTPVSVTGGSLPYTASGPSIDQMVAAQIGKGVALPSLQVGVDGSSQGGPGEAGQWWSHNGANAPNPCIYSCRDAFNRLFGGAPAAPMTGTTSPPAPGPADTAAKMRKSILDTVIADTSELQAQLGSTDRARLDQHLTGIREIENRLALMGQIGPTTPAAGCHPATPPDPTLVGRAESYDIRGTLVNKTMSDLVALALACDITRVFVVQFVKPGSHIVVSSLGVTEYHAITHSEWTGPRVRGVVNLFMTELNVFINAIKALPEGSGSVIDNCAIMATCDCNQGPMHGSDDYPILMFGKAGGLKAGIHYRSATAENACLVPVTMAAAVGANVMPFGNGDALVTQPMSALLG